MDACVFNLSQIGELCRVVDDKYTKMHPEMIYELLAGDWHGISTEISTEFFFLLANSQPLCYHVFVTKI